MSVCKNGALKLGGAIEYIDRQKCIVCGACVERCPSKALTLAATDYSSDDIVRQITKNEPLFKSMNGGVTFSGGEPALQSEFIEEVVDKLSLHNIHFALDSCGQAPFAAYEKLLPKIDLLLFDIKELDQKKHKIFTGADNSLILDNFHKIISYISENSLKAKVWIRTPLIPNYTASAENISAIAQLLNDLPPKSIERWEICSFNNMCIDKYRQVGKSWALGNEDLLTKQQAEEFLSLAKEIAPKINIRLTGLTRR